MEIVKQFLIFTDALTARARLCPPVGRTRDRWPLRGHRFGNSTKYHQVTNIYYSFGRTIISGRYILSESFDRDGKTHLVRDRLDGSAKKHKKKKHKKKNIKKKKMVRRLIECWFYIRYKIFYCSQSDFVVIIAQTRICTPFV